MYILSLIKTKFCIFAVQTTLKGGKRFSRYQRRWYVKIVVTFTKDDGTVIKPHRKLNMMLDLFFRGGINKKTLKKEEAKLLTLLAIQEARENRTGQNPIDLSCVENMIEQRTNDYGIRNDKRIQGCIRHRPKEREEPCGVVFGCRSDVYQWQARHHENQRYPHPLQVRRHEARVHRD